jgi:hypothetical protein
MSKYDQAAALRRAGDEITVRDHFATAALNGLMTNAQVPLSVSPELLAGASYEVADAMLAERERRAAADADA